MRTWTATLQTLRTAVLVAITLQQPALLLVSAFFSTSAVDNLQVSLIIATSRTTAQTLTSTPSMNQAEQLFGHAILVLMRIIPSLSVHNSSHSMLYLSRTLILLTLPVGSPFFEFDADL